MADNIIEGPPVPEELVGGPGIPPHEIIFEFAKRDLGDVFMVSTNISSGFVIHNHQYHLVTD